MNGVGGAETPFVQDISDSSGNTIRNSVGISAIYGSTPTSTFAGYGKTCVCA